MSSPGIGKRYDKISGHDRNIDSDGNMKFSSISLITALTKKTAVSGLIDKVSDGKAIVLQCIELSIFTPDGLRTLLGGFELSRIWPISPMDLGQYEGGVNFEIVKGDRVLVSGPSGCGKSSLLRAISGLWELGEGQVIWNIDASENDMNGRKICHTKNEVPNGVFFLPQKPYNLLGSLRQQIAYPDIIPGDDDEGVLEEAVAKVFEGISSPLVFTDIRNPLQSSTMDTGEVSPETLDVDVKLLDILRQVRLEGLASRMGSGDERLGLSMKKDWSKVLSLGEQQRLAFARILYNQKTITVYVFSIYILCAIVSMITHI